MATSEGLGTVGTGSRHRPEQQPQQATRPAIAGAGHRAGHGHQQPHQVSITAPA
ncbi:hypothetical protein [Limnohabitans sp. DM1]|uniref:hypothetical protein n=1 Tax=Limnohabitans sp. DM1 TaxID=1597955 RepID=UPI000ACA1EE1|nr:hypothetical protein [Limnohabitans sp. DM1]